MFLVRLQLASLVKLILYPTHKATFHIFLPVARTVTRCRVLRCSMSSRQGNPRDYCSRFSSVDVVLTKDAIKTTKASNGQPWPNLLWQVFLIIAGILISSLCVMFPSVYGSCLLCSHSSSLLPPPLYHSFSSTCRSYHPRIMTLDTPHYFESRVVPDWNT